MVLECLCYYVIGGGGGGGGGCQLLENHLATHLSVGSHLAWELLQVMQEKNNTTNVFSATENTTNPRETMWDKVQLTLMKEFT